MQERTLTLDQRLAVLGFFCSQLQEFIETNQFEKISALAETYTTENFLSQNLETMLSAVNFNSKDFIKILFGAIFPSLYSSDRKHQKFLDALKKILKIEISESGAVEINKVEESFLNLTDDRKNFVNNFSATFENYLVNEFFSNLYPFNIEEDITKNFAVFVITYKILELFAFATIYNENKNFITVEKTKLIEIISELSATIDHSEIYLEKISQAVEDKNIFEIMKTFLRV